MARQECDYYESDKPFKELTINTNIALSGTWAGTTSKSITIPINVPTGYTPICIKGYAYSITANGATGYTQWIYLLRYGIENNNVILDYVARADITYLSSFNVINLKVICVKSTLI